MSSDASIINGIESAKAMIAKVGENEENKDMQSFHLFLESQCSAKREEKNYKWRKTDETVPAGWMIAPRSNMVRSPSGLYFVNRSNLVVFLTFLSLVSRRAALQHLIREEGSCSELVEHLAR